MSETAARCVEYIRKNGPTFASDLARAHDIDVSNISWALRGPLDDGTLVSTRMTRPGQTQVIRCISLPEQDVGSIAGDAPPAKLPPAPSVVDPFGILARRNAARTALLLLANSRVEFQPTVAAIAHIDPGTGSTDFCVSLLQGGALYLRVGEQRLTIPKKHTDSLCQYLQTTKEQ